MTAATANATVKTTRAKTARKTAVKKKAVAKRRSSQAQTTPETQSEPRAQARGPRSATGESPGDDAVSPRTAYRLRMRLVGDLLHASVGELAEANTEADRLGRGAYLHILGQVFEALDGLSQAIALDDLVKLSRVVAEQRRAELNSRKVELAGRALSTGGGTTPGAGAACAANPEADFDARTLPSNFGEVVQRIYGASFAEDIETCEEDGEARTNASAS